MSAFRLSCGLASPALAEAVPVAQVQSLPALTGMPREGTELRADTSDSWTLGGQAATVTLREYRLLVAGSVVAGPQTDPAVVLPMGSAGQTYAFQIRVATVQSSGAFSAWVTLSDGAILYAAPAAPGALPTLSLGQGDPDQTFDLDVYFTGTDLSYDLQTGALPAGSSLTGSVLRIAAAEPFGPATAVLRATNPAGSALQDLGITISAALAVPGAFQSADWTVSPAPEAGAADIAVLALPADGGAALTALEHSIDGAAWTSLTAAPAPGSFDLFDLVTQDVPASMQIRARNRIGTGPASDPRQVTATSTLSLTSTADGEIDGTTGLITITVSAPLVYAAYDAGNGPGVFLADNADLATGPINLMPPQIIHDGSPDAGGTLTVRPGLWIYDSDITAPPTSTWQWFQSASAIAGATGTSYIAAPADAGQSLALQEAATTAIGARSAVSAPVAIAGAPAGDLASYVQNAINPGNPVTTDIDVSGYAAGDRLIGVYGCTILPAGGIAVNGSAATLEATANFGSERRGHLFSYVLQAVDISAGTVTVEVVATGGQLHGFVLFHSASGSVGDVAILNNALSGSVTPVQAENTVIHVSWGVDEAFGGATGLVYTLGPAARLYNVTSGNTGSAAGVVQNAPPSGQSFAWAKDGTGNHASFLFVVE